MQIVHLKKKVVIQQKGSYHPWRGELTNWTDKGGER